MTASGLVAPSWRRRIGWTAVSAVLAAVGTAAIVSETHSGWARFKGFVTLQGDAAVLAGVFFLVLALLPLAVWLPQRWTAPALVLWWLGLMALLTWTVLRA